VPGTQEKAYLTSESVGKGLPVSEREAAISETQAESGGPLRPDQIDVVQEGEPTSSYRQIVAEY
jgi:hypothetical protein